MKRALFTISIVSGLALIGYIASYFLFIREGAPSSAGISIAPTYRGPLASKTGESFFSGGTGHWPVSSGHWPDEMESDRRISTTQEIIRITPVPSGRLPLGTGGSPVLPALDRARLLVFGFWCFLKP